jgi:hypothetical protein
MGKGGMMKFCENLCRRATVVTETEILRLERKPGSHLYAAIPLEHTHFMIFLVMKFLARRYTLFKRVRADVSLRGTAAQDSSALTRPQELACGSFDAVLCCLPPRAACALMRNVRSFNNA